MKIHVFGRTFMDLFIYGEKVHDCKIIETPGGSALNASLGFSLLGMDSYLHASHGNDPNGQRIKSLADEWGVHTDRLIRHTGSTNRFISKNGKAIAASVAQDLPSKISPESCKEAYCLLFATETGPETLESVFNIPWKGLFIDLGPKYIHNRFVDSPDNAIIIGNEKEAENNACDVIKRGKNGARWHHYNVAGNGRELPYTTGAGDLFDVVFIACHLKGMPPVEQLKQAVRLAQKSCLIPGSSTKMEILREFNHSV